MQGATCPSWPGRGGPGTSAQPEASLSFRCVHTACQPLHRAFPLPVALAVAPALASRRRRCAQGLTEPQHWHHLAEACVAASSELVQDVVQGSPGPQTIARLDRISDEARDPHALHGPRLPAGWAVPVHASAHPACP